MNPVRWKQVKDLYEAASERPGSDRAAFLAEACAGDGDLRREVQRLLDQPVDTGGLFDLVAASSFVADNGQDLIGARLGVFELRELIGRGGMGEVYRDHQLRDAPEDCMALP